jgi:hypothetical protein
VKTPDSILSAYTDVAERMHGSAGRDIGNEVGAPDSCEKIGTCPNGDVLRCNDGWGSYWFVDPPKGPAEYIATNMADVMAVDFKTKEIGDKITAHPDVAAGPGRKRMSMHYEAWDRAVVEALGGDMVADTEKSAVWSIEKIAELPDSSFSFIEPGGVKDAVGKTSPRVLRHLPYKDASGQVDPVQLAKALEAVDGASLPAATRAKVKARLESVAAKHAVHDVAKVWSDEASAAVPIENLDGKSVAHDKPLASLDKYLTRRPVAKAVFAVQEAFIRLARGTLNLPATALDLATAEVVTTDGERTVYKIACAGQDHYFLESGGSAAHLPLYAELEKSRYAPVFKSGEAQRYTLGVCYPSSGEGSDEADFHGDVMRSEELEKSAWGFMDKAAADRVGLMHKAGTSGSGRVVESYIWRGPAWTMKDVSGQEQEVTPGSWMLGVVWEPEAWGAIKRGEINGYSLQGAARKEAVT